MKLLICAVGAWVIAFFLGWLLVEVTFAQSPQGGARVSYVQCPPHIQFDPARQYEKFTRKFGTQDNPIICTEYVDRKEDGAPCQVAFVCEDAT